MTVGPTGVSHKGASAEKMPVRLPGGELGTDKLARAKLTSQADILIESVPWQKLLPSPTIYGCVDRLSILRCHC